MSEKQTRTIKGWTLSEPISSGIGSMPCFPFFMHKYMAAAVAREDSLFVRGIRVVPATLTKPKGRHK